MSSAMADGGAPGYWQWTGTTISGSSINGIASYQKFSSGLVMMWGQLGSVATGSNVEIGNVTFPVAFPNYCQTVVANVGGPASYSRSQISTQINLVSSGSFQYMLDTGNPSYSISNPVPLHWFAIGF
jgi:hypothetical protein